MKPTKPNIRTVQRQEVLFAELVFNAIPAVGFWETGQVGTKLRGTALDNRTAQMWIQGKTGLPFVDRPAECKKIVLALAPLGMKPATDSWLRETNLLAGGKK
jgi:hypothetical protein